MRSALALFALLVALPTTAQETADLPFAAVYARPGLPDFPPLRGLADGLHVPIPLPDTTQALSVVWGDRDGVPFYAVLHQRPESSSLSRLSAGAVVSAVDLTLTPGLEDVTPLEVRVLPEHGLVLYRWPLSEGTAAGGVPTAAPNPLAIGTAPSLAVERLDGTPVSLDQYRGRVVVLNWWATTCSPCVVELPGLNGLVERYGDDVSFVAVAWDAEAAVEAFLAERPFRYEQTVGTEAGTALFGPAFPRHVILDRQGRVVFDTSGGGAETATELAPEIDAALAR